MTAPIGVELLVLSSERGWHVAKLTPNRTVLLKDPVHDFACLSPGEEILQVWELPQRSD